MNWYEGHLEARPIITKGVTGGILYAVGDCVGQNVANKDSEEPVPYDYARTMRCTLYGLIFYPPLAHLHYNFLEWLVVTRMATSVAAMPFVKMFIEQFTYFGVGSNIYYHAVLGGLQGMTVAEIDHRVRDTLWDTMKAQWAFWPVAQLINFKFVPVRHQLNYVMSLSLVWTTFLSLAFPPPKMGSEEGTAAALEGTAAALEEK